jgi:ATP-dependent exoDNAse (exonuclease V) beta subunit
MIGAALADAEARLRIEQDLGTSLVVEAAAGTGKTTMLVRRMVAAIAAGRADVGQIVAVTFTEAAAGDLKLRLRAAIERARVDAAADGAARLTDALARLEEARVGTIHAFCADLLRERPIEARIDPLFEVAPDDVARALLARVVDGWFERQLHDPHPAVRRLIRRLTRAEEGPREALRSAAWDLCEQRDYDAPWTPAPFDREPVIDALLSDLRALGAYAPHGDPNDYLTVSLEHLRRFVSDVDRRELVVARDYDLLEAQLFKLARERHFTWRGWPRDKPGFPRGELRARRAAIKERIDAFVQAAGADLAFGLREALAPTLQEYAEAKARAGGLDFLDLLLRARDLLRDDAVARASLQERFRLIFVDEFQDTDPLQAEILLLLASDDPADADWRRARIAPGKLFVVGDPKQSIYRFRRADVSLYEEVKRIVAASGGASVALTASFRAVPEIQSLVNVAFANVMRGDTPTQAAYVPLSRVRAPYAAQPAVIALPVPEPYGKRDITNFAIEASAPQVVAAFVDWLIHESGWTFETEDGKRERIRPEHVCLLFRRLQSRYSDVAPRYLRAFDARSIPHVLTGASAMQDREEVRGLCNALAAIERPDDELSVFAALRGPFFALLDSALLAFRDRFGPLHPYRGGRAADAARADLPPPLAEVAAALAVLRALHGARNHRPFSETMARLLSATRAHAGLAVWPTGEQALANVARLLELGRRCERSGVGSFRAFVDAMMSAAQGSASDPPAYESDTPGVRLMTVHKAKGLEFPVVILADVTHREVPTEPSRVTDPARRLCALKLCGATPRDLLERADAELEREREESARILYVAATRARDLLVVPTVADKRIAGWTAALHPALYPAEERARSPLRREVPPARTFGDDATVARPDGLSRPAASVCPGVHAPEAGGEHEVVWWDPRALPLEREVQVGLRQQVLLEADPHRSPAGESRHVAWQEERARVRAQASRPSVEVMTATERAARADESETERLLAELAKRVRIEQVDTRAERPAGARFGTLVHMLLASVDFEQPEMIADLALVQQRIVAATDLERDAAVEAVRRALSHPLLEGARRAAAAGHCRREAPACIDSGGVLVEGVVDAAYFEPSRNLWVVVDFKTDRELARREPEYRRQVALYALAIERASGARAEPFLLRV